MTGESRLLQWLRAAEDLLFDAAAWLEHRIGLTPRSTRIVPRPADRHVVRVVTLAVPVLCGCFLIGERALRARVMLAVVAVAFIAVLGIFLQDRRRSG